MAYTDIDKPSDYFNTVLYTGNGAVGGDSTTISSLDFAPNLVWIKNRTSSGDATSSHALTDTVRGVTKTLSSNLNTAEATYSNALTNFSSNGFTVSDKAIVNGNGDSLVAWNWKAGTSFTNDASATGIGSIDSTGSVNTDAGFSIISWSGTGSNGTIAHGLGSTPQVVLLKELNGTNNWLMSHQPLSASLGDYTRFMTLNSTGAVSGAGNVVFQGSAFTSSVFNVGTSAGSNRNGGTYIGYCFAEKQGYSKVDLYTGNGNADGTFTYTGFKPAFVMIKRSDASDSWCVFDNKRLGYNVNNYTLFANQSAAENTEASIDFLSNGFKLRGTQTRLNASNGTYIYMAFAENPFVASNYNVATAR